MTYGAQKDKEFPRLLCPRNNFLFLRAQRNGRVPHGLTPYRGKCIVLLYPSEHRGPILSTLSEPLSKQLVSVLGAPGSALLRCQRQNVVCFAYPPSKAIEAQTFSIREHYPRNLDRHNRALPEWH